MHGDPANGRTMYYIQNVRVATFGAGLRGTRKHCGSVRGTASTHTITNHVTADQITNSTRVTPIARAHSNQTYNGAYNRSSYTTWAHLPREGPGKLKILNTAAHHEVA